MIYIYFGSYPRAKLTVRCGKTHGFPMVSLRKLSTFMVGFPHPLRFRLVVHRKLCLSFWLSSPVLKVKLGGRYLGERTHRWSVGRKPWTLDFR